MLALISFSSLALAGEGNRDFVPPSDETEAQPAGEPAAPALAYDVTIEGEVDAALRAVLEGSARLYTLRDRPPPTVAGLRRRAEGDLERLVAALQSEGYYAAEVGYRLDETAEPLAVVLEVEPGARYRLRSYDISYAGAAAPPPELRPTAEELGIALEAPARAPEILEVERSLLARLGERGYPLARVAERKAFVEHASESMEVRLEIDVGSPARFGPLTVEGLEAVEEDHLRRLVEWQPGEVYDSRKVEATRRAISATGLFSGVRVEPAETPDANGALPMTIAVTETAQRSIGFGANYSTDVGFGGDVFWEHRNFFGRNEKLLIELAGAQIGQSFDATLRKPLFLDRDQALILRASAENEDTNAFDQRSAGGFVGLERQLSETWKGTLGFESEYSDVEDNEGQRELFLIGLPLSADRDTTDDLLNPTEGMRLETALGLFGGTGDDDLLFGKASVGGSAYQAIDAESRFVLAGRARVGSLVGVSRDTVPADRRFYAGGGGSIRGFKFQEVGELDEDGDPLGGRSLLELSGELRARVFGDFGVVPFIDGGSAFTSSVPDFDETLRWAGGLGLRYFTGIGPVRFDIAFPLNKRDEDDDFQFYVSFGQAF